MDEFKYPQLSKFVGIQRTYGTILFVISIIWAVVVVIGGMGAGVQGSFIISLIIGAVIVFVGYLIMNLAIAIGEFAEVVMDIAENTRKIENNTRAQEDGNWKLKKL